MVAMQRRLRWQPSKEPADPRGGQPGLQEVPDAPREDRECLQGPAQGADPAPELRGAEENHDQDMAEVLPLPSLRREHTSSPREAMIGKTNINQKKSVICGETKVRAVM